MTDNVNDKKNLDKATLETYMNVIAKEEKGSVLIKRATTYYITGILLLSVPFTIRYFGVIITLSEFHKFLFTGSSWLGGFCVIASTVIGIVGMSKLLAARKNLRLLYKTLKKGECCEGSKA